MRVRRVAVGCSGSSRDYERLILVSGTGGATARCRRRRFLPSVRVHLVLRQRGVVARVLLILRMEVVHRVGDDVARVDRLLQPARDALQRPDGRATATPWALGRAAVATVRERKVHRDRREKHLDADEEVLVAGGDRALADVVHWTDDTSHAEDRKQHTCSLQP